jgi:hypothetical protein
MSHMHNRKFIDIKDALEYIHTHDSKTIYDRRFSRERRVEKLLKEISIHNKTNNINKVPV